MTANAKIIPCASCVNGTRIPSTIRFFMDPVILITCFACDQALPHSVVKALHQIPIRSQVMADRANSILDAEPQPKPRKAIKVKKMKRR